jgi:hypothetical protein
MDSLYFIVKLKTAPSGISGIALSYCACCLE